MTIRPDPVKLDLSVVDDAGLRYTAHPDPLGSAHAHRPTNTLDSLLA